MIRIISLIGLLLGCQGFIFAGDMGPTTTMPQTFLSVGGGWQYSNVHSQTNVNNHSDFASPNNLDVYSINKRNSGVFLASVGRLFERGGFWLPGMTLGVSYQYYYPTNLSGEITQYSLPDFQNYTYQVNTYANNALGVAKLYLLQWNQYLWAPFVSAGIGGSWNTVRNYVETPVPNITPRISPRFRDQTNTEFTYAFGAGMDFHFAMNWMFSVFYNYQNLGQFASGIGTGSWANDTLNLGTFSTNNLLLTLSYLF